MISATSASNTTSIGAATTGFNISELTPEALLAYCAERMGSIDDQVKQYMGLAQAREKARGALNELKTALKTHGGGLVADPNDNPKKEILAKYDTAIEAAKKADPDLANRLTAERDKFKSTAIEHDGMAPEGYENFRDVYDGFNKVSKEEMENFGDAVTGITSDLDEKSQLDMMTLQSLMSKRQTAVQMCTNLVSAVGDTSKAIAANIGK